MPEAPSTAVQPSSSGTVSSSSATQSTERGTTHVSHAVVAKIAGIATREISGVHDMGSSSSRALGSIRERIPVGSTTPNVMQGVSVEVGERQAAVDLDIVVDYGVAISDLTQAVRQNVIRRVESMAGLEVTEVNISVDDIYLGELDDQEEEEPSRVS